MHDWNWKDLKALAISSKDYFMMYFVTFLGGNDTKDKRSKYNVWITIGKQEFALIECINLTSDSGCWNCEWWQAMKLVVLVLLLIACINLIDDNIRPQYTSVI